jgi:hypothetical protein
LTSHRLGETCKIFHCHLMTLYRWVQHFLTYGASFSRQTRSVFICPIRTNIHSII